MAIPTMIPIATYTLPSTASSYTFTSIPQTYKDLVLVMSNLSENTNQQGYIFLNGDTNTNYSRIAFYGNGSSAGSFRQTNIPGINVGMAGTTDFQDIVINIFNYSNTAIYKTVLDKERNSGVILTQAHLWRSAAAVTSIVVSSFDYSTALQAGATLTLYGIH